MDVILGIFFLSFALNVCKVEPGTGNGNKDQVADDYMHQQERQIIAAINDVRTNPAGWCERNGLPMLDSSPVGEALHDPYRMTIGVQSGIVSFG
jgi:hypothetical protein